MLKCNPRTNFNRVPAGHIYDQKNSEAAKVRVLCGYGNE
jgi:hypothetical protein